ncbi:uncharacterized protein LOC142981847 [Anticarsia gemmatalis]|uniref:uncharacterized protein LOC142981847 n=1 Tax=Anticarsia gemmatalis TaxID=129554 RepID=UPI003F766DF8
MDNPSDQLLHLPANVVQEVRKIYSLDKNGRIEDALTIIEEWIQKQDHILKKDFDRDYLEKALIGCKGSVEKTKKQIDRLCTMKTLLPHFFTKTNIRSELNYITDLALLVPLPTLTKDYYRIIFMKMNSKQLTEKTFMDYYQYNIILCEYLKAHDYVNGFIFINDYEDTSIMDLMTKINSVELQQFLTLLIEGFGARIKGIHLLTSSKAIDLFAKLIKQFLSPKIANRINVHKTLKDLHSVVPKELLPSEYGGTQKPLSKLAVEWADALSTDEHVAHMKMMNKACTDERLRRSAKFNEEYMGMPGAFRNLSVD